MSSLKTTRAVFGDARPPAIDAARELAAWCMIGASNALSRIAARLLRPAAATTGSIPQLEFHCDAGAPEGALYLDGVWIASVPGVTRL